MTRWLTSFWPRRRAAPRPPRTTRLTLEAFEERSLPAGMGMQSSMMMMPGPAPAAMAMQMPMGMAMPAAMPTAMTNPMVAAQVAQARGTSSPGMTPMMMALAAMGTAGMPPGTTVNITPAILAQNQAVVQAVVGFVVSHSGRGDLGLLAIADVDRDGITDIILAVGRGRATRIIAIDGLSGTRLF